MYSCFEPNAAVLSTLASAWSQASAMPPEVEADVGVRAWKSDLALWPRPLRGLSRGRSSAVPQRLRLYGTSEPRWSDAPYFGDARRAEYISLRAAAKLAAIAESLTRAGR